MGGCKMTITVDQKAKWQQWINEASKGLSIELQTYKEKVLPLAEQLDSDKEIIHLFIKAALENIDEATPDWTFFASRLYVQQLYHEAANNRAYNITEQGYYGDFHGLLQTLTEKGIYTPVLLDTYTREEVAYFGEQIQPERDSLSHYLAIYTLATRYLATDHEKNVYELPQERWMVIAMHLMQDENPDRRTERVLEAYWALSNLYMTVATPTMNNAGKTHGQLSSCFIDTVEDSLQSIYDVNTDVAQLSKNGGGIGVYMGKVRGRGSSIKGFKGM